MPVQSNIDASIERGLEHFADVPKDELIGALMMSTDVNRSLADALSYSIVVVTSVDAETGKSLASFLMEKVLTEDAFAVIQALADQARADI